MTSNTAPSGEASASTIADSSNLAYKAFAQVTSQGIGWFSGGSTSSVVASKQWLQYKFSEPHNIRAITTKGVVHPNPSIYSARSITCTLKGSNDGITWNTIKTNIAIKPDELIETKFTNSESYSYYRIDEFSDFNYSLYNVWYVGINQMQLYGK